MKGHRVVGEDDEHAKTGVHFRALVAVVQARASHARRIDDVQPRVDDGDQEVRRDRKALYRAEHKEQDQMRL